MERITSYSMLASTTLSALSSYIIYQGSSIVFCRSDMWTEHYCPLLLRKKLKLIVNVTSTDSTRLTCRSSCAECRSFIEVAQSVWPHRDIRDGVCEWFTLWSWTPLDSVTVGDLKSIRGSKHCPGKGKGCGCGCGHSEVPHLSRYMQTFWLHHT